LWSARGVAIVLVSAMTPAARGKAKMYHIKNRNGEYLNIGPGGFAFGEDHESMKIVSEIDANCLAQHLRNSNGWSVFVEPKYKEGFAESITVAEPAAPAEPAGLKALGARVDSTQNRVEHLASRVSKTEMARGKDTDRVQSLFLWQLDMERELKGRLKGVQQKFEVLHRQVARLELEVEAASITLEETQP